MTQRKKVTTTRCTCGCMGNCKGTLAHLIDALPTDNNLDVPEPAYAKVAVMTIYGLRPPPATTRRQESYDTQKQPLRGRCGSAFLSAKGEVQDAGKHMQLEALLFRGIILHFIMHGVDVTAQNVEHAYSVIRHVCDHCGSMQFPLFNLSIANVQHYLPKVHATIDL